MAKKLLFLTLITFISISAFAQNQQKEACASSFVHNRLIQQDPAYRTKILANEQLIQNEILNQKSQKKGYSTLATVYTIPVVVHVIHLGEAVGTGTNISNAQIQSAIDNMNDAFRNTAPYSGGTDIEVEFALAQRDPSCNATTGIVRVNGAGVSDYSTQGITTSGSDNEITIKALSKWSSSNYYNIWVVAGIDGNMGGGGVQGYAYFPGAPATVDGAVMLYTAIGYDPTGAVYPILNSFTRYNSTITHELGHAFNLYHSFEGDGTGATCPTGNQCGSALGDCCSDTPPHKRSTSNCNSGGTNACDGNSSNALFVNNFMDYSSDACKVKFTAEQKTRMRAAIYTSRESLINSLATTAPSGSLPASACTPPTEVNVGNYPLGVYGFTFNGLDVPSGNTNADGGYVDRTCYYQTTVDAGVTYPVTVNTGINHNHDVRIYIDYNNDGDFVDAGETVFSSDNVLTTHSGNIAIPVSPPVTGQVLRMRVFADYFTSTVTSCFQPAYGQAEDFGIKINAGGSAPVAAFTASSTTFCAGGSTNFTDQSTNTPTSWSWTFQGGTPSSSTAQNPSVTYTAAGTYSVSLTATNAGGSDPENKTGYINVLALPSVTLTPTNASCGSSNGSVVSSVSNGTAPYTYAWSTGGTTTAISSIAAANYTCTVTDNKGCLSTKTVTVGNDACGPTQLIASDCGITLTSMEQYIKCGGVVGATDYRYRISHAASGFTTVYGFYNTYFKMSNVNGVGYAKTYNVEVSAFVGGSWGSYGSICTVTTPALPTTQLVANDCGVTVTALNQYLSCSGLAAATDYRYRITHAASGFSVVYTKGTHHAYFQMSAVPGVGYAKTYNVEVAAYIDGAWGGYGAICTVTTPALPATQLTAANCGITLTSMDQYINCIGLPGTVEYRYRISHVATGFTTVYGFHNTYFKMTLIAGVEYGKTYNVEIAAFTGGAWGDYGPICTVTTPSLPTTQLAASSCNITEGSIYQYLSCTGLAGATGYRYRATHAGTGFTNTYVFYNTYFRMIDIPGVTHNKTYDVDVSVYLNNSWGSYGPVCTVTTPISGRFAGGTDPDDGSSYAVVLSPNPVFESEIKLALDGVEESSEIFVEITNLLGERMSFSQIGYTPGALISLPIDDRYSSGIYFLSVVLNNEKSVQKFIVNR